jgi:hypothetical protein
MTVKPQNWVEEDRDEFVDCIVDGIVSTLTLEEMRDKVWDQVRDEIVFNEWSDLFMLAEEYAPDLLERFQNLGGEEISQ